MMRAWIIADINGRVVACSVLLQSIEIELDTGSHRFGEQTIKLEGIVIEGRDATPDESAFVDPQAALPAPKPKRIR